jgi:hypothetical protein
VGRLPSLNSSAEMNRPQPGGYSTCKITLGERLQKSTRNSGRPRVDECRATLDAVQGLIDVQHSYLVRQSDGLVLRRAVDQQTCCLLDQALITGH